METVQNLTEKALQLRGQTQKQIHILHAQLDKKGEPSLTKP